MSANSEMDKKDYEYEERVLMEKPLDFLIMRVQYICERYSEIG